MSIQDKKVAIIGAGPGGLTLARLLQISGISVTVFERDANDKARVQGSPLDLHENSGLKAMIRAGLLEEFKKNFLPGADKTKIMDQRAEVFFSDHDTEQVDDFDSPFFRPEISRGTLRRILLASLNPETVVWNSQFISMEKEGEGWALSFKSRDTVYADLVIGAEGANSKIRSYITDSKPFYTGITMLEGNIFDAVESAPKMFDLLAGGKIMAFGKGKDILMGQKDNNEIGFYASFKTTENWAANSGLNFSDRAVMLEWFHAAYEGWDPVWNELFERAATPFVPRPIYCMPFNQSWKARPNLTILGDAAHVMPPFAGEGANMAMLDALELSECLTSDKYATTTDAISHYETDMRARAAVAAKESQVNGEAMHSDDALEKMLAFFQRK